MINIQNEGIILTPTEFAFEKKAVFNPACIKVDGITHMYYRALSESNISSIGYCQLEGARVVARNTEPLLAPEYDYESMGLEDPRITFLDGTYYMFYTVYDGKNALIAYATSHDLVHFEKQGLVSPKITYDEAEDIFRHANLHKNYQMFEQLFMQLHGNNILLWEKDAALFPKKINGKFALIHRVLPGIQIIYFDSFTDLSDKYWREYLEQLNDHIILDPVFEYENRSIGGGCPPIETEDGWLLIYHSVEDNPEGRVYHASAALLDLNDPLQVIGRLKKPLFSPNEEWERRGVVNNVVFPTGTVLEGNKLTIYYGAADSLVGAKSLNLSELMAELKK